MTEGGFDPQPLLSQLTEQPGVYRFFRGDDVLYVGKARNLKRRVSSYFTGRAQQPKTAALVAQTQRVEITVTPSEDEALLLESRLIKEYQPRYNILFRDDKSYPFIHLSSHRFPQLSFRRALKRGAGRWFGPYPNAGAVRDTLNSLHRIFKLRECDDTVFSHRTRPCLQHQIGRCTAPCVGLIAEPDYAQQVRDAERLLQGDSSLLVQELGARMESAAALLDYERAAEIKAQLSTIRRLQNPVSGGEDLQADVLMSALRHGLACVVVLQIRDGKSLGHRTYFPKAPADVTSTELLTAFLEQMYLGNFVPNELILETPLDEADWLEQQLNQTAGRRVRLVVPQRGVKTQWLEQARATLEQALLAEQLSRVSVGHRLSAVQMALNLPTLPTRMECFDISHTSGEQTVASCVVFRDGVPHRSSYRRLNIEGITPGDDYAAMNQAVARRFGQISRGESETPDVIFIDGGKGQLQAAIQAIPPDLAIVPQLVAIAKGEERKPGKEQLFLPGVETPLILAADSPALHLIQQIRDESHDWALRGHRKRRTKERTQSELETIVGLGPTRRRALLKAFGGVRQIAEASLTELKKTPGIHSALAERIFQHFRGE